MRAHSSAARPVRSTGSSVPTSASLASSRLASRISSISWSSSPMLREISSRAALPDRLETGRAPAGPGTFPRPWLPCTSTPGALAVSISSSPMRIRVSGERSSCEAFASNDLCDRTSVSMRAAAALKRRDRSATSSWPSSGTRTVRSPSPQRCTPRCKISRRCVSRRTIGNRPTPTASPTRPSSQKKPVCGRTHGGCPPRSARGPNCNWNSWPSVSEMVNSSASPGRLVRRDWPVPITRSCVSRTTTSRGNGALRCDSAICQAQPAASVTTATPASTASQIRTYR